MLQRYWAIVGGAIVVVCIIAFFCKPHLLHYYNSFVNPTSSDADTTAVRHSTTAASSQQSTQPEVYLEELLAKFNEALQNNDFETAIGYYSQVVNKDENQMRDLDKILVEKFNTLIGNCTFDLANNLYIELNKIYNNADSFIDELKNSFKSYVKANKSKVDKKPALIENITLAKSGNYDYIGIDTDLAEIKNLGLVPAQNNSVELSVYCDDNNTTSQIKASDIIEIEAGKLYIIKNPLWEQNARFAYNADISGIQLAPEGNGPDAVIKIKANESAIGKSVNIHYKKSKNIKFTFQIKIIESRSKTANDLKIK